MSITLFLSVLMRRLRGRRRRDIIHYDDTPQRLRLASPSAVRLVVSGGRIALRFLNYERDERVRLHGLTSAAFSVVNGRPVFRFLGQDTEKNKRDNRKQRYEKVEGRVRLTSANSMKLYEIKGSGYVAMLNN